jgi:hypothetical protein
VGYMVDPKFVGTYYIAYQNVLLASNPRADFRSFADQQSPRTQGGHSNFGVSKAKGIDNLTSYERVEFNRRNYLSQLTMTHNSCLSFRYLMLF